MYNKQLILIRLADDKFILIKFILCSEKKNERPFYCMHKININELYENLFLKVYIASICMMHLMTFTNSISTIWKKNICCNKNCYVK